MHSGKLFIYNGDSRWRGEIGKLSVCVCLFYLPNVSMHNIERVVATEVSLVDLRARKDEHLLHGGGWPIITHPNGST